MIRRVGHDCGPGHIYSLDELGLWDGRWQTPEATLEERLEQHCPERHRQFVEQQGRQEEIDRMEPAPTTATKRAAG